MNARQAISILTLEKHLLGELRGSRAREVEARLARDHALRRTVEEMERSNREFHIRFPAEKIVPEILGRYARQSGRAEAAVPSEQTPARTRRRFFLIVPAAAAAAALALLLVLRPWDRAVTGVPVLDTSPDTTIIKGLTAVDLKKTQLLIFRRLGEQAELMQDGQSAAEGDLLQLAYVSGGEPFGLILSLDGRGRVTRHFPLAPGRPSSLELNAKVLLPVAIELDDAPLFERFFFVTSDKPIDEDEVLRLASELASDPLRAGQAPLSLPQGLNQSSLVILKGKAK